MAGVGARSGEPMCHPGRGQPGRSRWPAFCSNRPSLPGRWSCATQYRVFTETGDAIGVAHACECAIPSAYNSGQLDRAAAYIDQALATLTTVGLGHG